MTGVNTTPAPSDVSRLHKHMASRHAWRQLGDAEQPRPWCT